METKSFTLTFKNVPGKLVFKYTQRGALWFLSWYECQAELNDEQCEWLSERFPTKLEHIDMVKNMLGNKAVITELPADLSFETFYKKYNDKLGKKKVAAAFWETLNESQRIAVHEHHDKEYLPYLAQPQNRFMAKKHINTYLNWLKDSQEI